MKRGIVIALLLALPAFYLGSMVLLSLRSRDFVLADHVAALPPMTVDQTLSFNQPQWYPALLGPWDAATPLGVNSDASRADLVLKLPADARYLALAGSISLDGDEPRHLRVSLDGAPVLAAEIRGQAGTATCSFSLALPASRRDVSIVSFDTSRSLSAAPFGLASDWRRLRFVLVSVEAGTVAAPPQCSNASIVVDSADGERTQAGATPSPL